MEKIIIKGKEYKYTFGYGAMMYYEQLTGSAFSFDGSICATLALHYSCLAVSNEDFCHSLAELSHELDASPKLRSELSAALTKEVQRFNVAGVDAAEIDKSAESDDVKKKG